MSQLTQKQDSYAPAEQSDTFTADATRGRHMIGLVERRGEQECIRAAAARAIAGTGSVVVVEGPAGIGKTSLLEAACDEAAAADLRVLRARGGSLESGVAYGAVRLLLERPLAELDDVTREDVLSGAAALAAPALEGAGVQTGGPADRGHAINHGLLWCVANLAERGPLLLALDDVHWFDAPSLRFVLYLARRVADLPVLIVAATRTASPGAIRSSFRSSACSPARRSCGRRPLTPGGVGQVLSSRLAADVAPEFAACQPRGRRRQPVPAHRTGQRSAGRRRPTDRRSRRSRAQRAPADAVTRDSAAGRADARRGT